jgi:regulatory protein
VNVFLDGAFAFSLDREVAASLCVGQVLDSRLALATLEQDQFQVSLDRALTFLGHRPRSEREIRDRLVRHETPPTILEQVIVRLREYGLVNDAAFARYWVEQRQTFRPRGPRLLRAELRQRGVQSDLAGEVAEETEEQTGDAAYRAAEKKARQLAAQRLDQRTYITRLGQFLARRGFDWDTIKPTAERLWRETQPIA